MSAGMTNWGGNITFGAARVHHPSTVDELRRLVAGSVHIRALGTGHSFSPIVDSPGDLVSVAGLPPAIDIDAGRSTVTVGAGVRYGELAPHLHAAGFALANLGSLPHISIAGSCATGTHGSGDRNGSLAAAVSAVELVTADGDLVTLSREADGDRFGGVVVALGGLGIVTRLTLDLVPSFEVRQYVYDDLPPGQLEEHAAEIFASGYSVSLMTGWTGPGIDQVWLKRRIDPDDDWTPGPRWMGATAADGPRHPIRRLSGHVCTEQRGVPGPWHERLPHFRLEFTPSSGQELQSEYLVPRRFGLDALNAIDGIRDRVAAVLQVCEIRTVAADDLWLSLCQGRDSLALHFTWVQDGPAVSDVLALIEERLAPYAARPHWGKLFGTDPDTMRGLYERLPDFVGLRHEFDPGGKFRNEFLDRYFPTTG
jgi:alditol oxidase